MFLKNIIEICILGESTERFLNMCSYHNIKLFDVRKTEDGCFMKIHASDFFLLKNIIKKSHVKVRIVRKEGIYFQFKKQAKRKIFFIASFFCLLLLWIGSRFLWGIKIEGNYAVTDDLIIDYLQENGIYYGMPLSQISIYDLKTNLRNTYDEITWVSIYLEGTNLHISLKENDTIKPKTPSISTHTDLITDETGIVESVLVRKGTAMVKVGDEVTKGDILISGKIEISGEDGTIQEIRSCKADGDVSLLYNYPIEERISLEYLTKEYTGRSMEKKELFYFDKQLPIPKFKIPYIKYDSISEKMEFPIFDFFSLPLEIKNIIYREYQMIKKKHTNSEAEKLLTKNLDKIIVSLEEKGVQIIEKNVKINTNSAYLYMTGNLVVRKTIPVK